MATEEPQIREKTSGPSVKQFSVFLLNRVGALLEIVRMLNESDVHVLALNSQDSTDSALVRLVVSDPDAVENIFDLNARSYRRTGNRGRCLFASFDSYAVSRFRQGQARHDFHP